MQIRQKRRITSFPTSIQIILTRECNLKCLYCSAEQFSGIEKEPELGTKEWTNLIKRLRDIQVFRVDFTGGEIFLKKDVFEILETAVKCKFHKIGITSNGTLVTDDVAKKLASLKLTEVAVSLDGDNDYNEMLRGKGNFKKTSAGISHLINHGITPSILFTPLRGNFRNIEALVDILYPMGVRVVSFNKLHPTGRSSRVYSDISLDCLVDADDFNQILDRIRNKYKDFKIDDPPLTYQCYPKMFRENGSNQLNKQKQTLKPCSAAHSTCGITASGWVIPCSEFYDFKGGNIRQQDILDIWKNSENFKTIRDLSNTTTDQIPYCKNCDYNAYCNAGCRADAYGVHGDLKAPDPFCPYWRIKQ